MDDDTDRAAEARKRSPFLTTDQAAFYVGLSRRTLEKMRWTCTGPRFRKHGRYVRYHIADLEAWSAEHEGRTSRRRAEDAPDARDARRAARG